MNNPKVHLIIAIVAAIIYIASFFQEQNLMNGIGAIVFFRVGNWSLHTLQKIKRIKLYDITTLPCFLN